ncbi:hypothetical protein MF271_23240 (plasmid) [Deinococcus sp. KNUC1210]|uniref:hypothetical protein n=1 Tax=Deinococcus sp. KNUC1210 TaxID=2917691 RepID=UPI001EF0FF92|nr:hypothetical protein [Deinococcus sp. KNUC1210]ULH17892.1 hypothetical protein MF271_23240 [Deinococcus sp. KNUC1210]
MRPILALLTALLVPVASAAPSTVVPSNAMPTGTYASWGTQWWIWALTSPEDADPVQDLTGQYCGVNQRGDIWFLAGTYENGTAVRRTCTIPVGKTVFFPILNYRVLAKSQETCTQNLQAVTAPMEAASGLSVRMDGEPLAGVTRGVTDGCVYLTSYRIWLGSDGYWMAVKFTIPGRHTLAFTGAMSGFRQDVSYTLVVK